MFPQFRAKPLAKRVSRTDVCAGPTGKLSSWASRNVRKPWQRKCRMVTIRLVVNWRAQFREKLRDTRSTS